MRAPAFPLLALALMAPLSSEAGQCLTSDSPGKICTANDFEVVDEQLITGPASCVEGEIIPTDVVVRVGVRGNRVNTYDIGYFIGDGDSSPINGESCTFDSLTPIEDGSNPFDGRSGVGPYRDLDRDGANVCGDALKDDGVIFKDFTLSSVLCQDANNDGNLDVAYAITWKQNSGSCDDPANPDNFSLATTSKCVNAIGDIDEIPVLPPSPEEPAIRVEKLAEPLIISPGEDVDYTINVENTGPITVILDTLTDDRFGDLNGQGSCSVPQQIDPGQVYTCAFNAFPTGVARSVHFNVVTGSGTGGGLPVSDTGTAFVSIIDSLRGGIGYLVWNDFNADGVKDENEPGIPGVTVNLLNGSGTLLDNRITDGAGAYAFEDLAAGSYQVEVLENSGPLSNLVRTTASNPIPVRLLPGQVFTEANFGYVGAEITLQKTADPQLVNAPQGTVTFTVEIANTGVIPVELIDLADDQYGNLLDSGACALPTAPLAPGDLYVCDFTEQIAGNPGDIHVNTVQAIAEDTVGRNPVFAADDAIVGIEDPNNGAIGDLIWQDDNGNGAVDEGEFGLDQVTVRLLRDSDSNGDYETEVATTVSSASGEYGFVNLAAGSYRVEITDDNQILADKYLTTPPEPRDIVLAPGQVFPNADFGYANIPTPRIVTLKTPTQLVHDAPSSEITYRLRVLNIGDTAVTIDELVDSRFGDLTAIPDSTCEADITISVRNLYKCLFTVTITGSPGDIHRNVVTAIGSDANDNIAIDAGGAFIVFRDPNEGAIGDQIWEDLDADGIFEQGEPGIANVTVDLYRGPVLIDSTVTDSSGNYGFTGLAEGVYQVRVTDTAGVLSGKVLTTGAEPLDVDLALGENFVDADFGYATAGIEVVKEGNRKVLLQPGGDVIYTATIRNTGYLDVTLNSLVDDRFGDLNGQGSCATPIAIPARTSVACQFIGSVTGGIGDVHTNIITATALDGDGNEITGEGAFDINIIGLNVGAAGYLVWNDENGDGIRDASEPGIGGVTLDLELDEDSNGTFERTAATTVSRQSGFYAFFPVPTGNWRIRVTDQYGVLRGQVLTGGTNPNNFALAGGQLYTDANFGYRALDTGGGPTPPIIPPLPGPTPPPQAIPTLPAWALALAIVAMLGAGGHLARTRISAGRRH